MTTRTKIILVLIQTLLILFALGIARVVWVVIHIHDDSLPLSRWTIKNNIEIPIRIVINSIPITVIRPAGQEVTSFYKPTQEQGEFIIRAFEFIPGEGQHFGWYDTKNDIAITGSVSTNLVSCAMYLWTELNSKAPVVTIEHKIEC